MSCTLSTPIPLGSKAVLHFRLSLGEPAPESSLDLAFTTAEPFRVLSLGCAGARVPVTASGTRYGREQALRCGPDDRQVVVELSAAPVNLGPIEGRNLVRFEPAVPGLTFDVADRQLRISGSFERETLYRVALTTGAAGAAGGLAAIVDGHGRHLDLRGPTETYLVFPQRESYLRWGASQGIVERFGPRMAPIEGRGDERVDLRLYPIDPLDRSLWPFPDSPVTVDESQRPPGPGEEPAPWKEADRGVPASELTSHLKVLGSPPVSTLVTLPLRREGSSARFGLDLGPHLDKLNAAGAAGTAGAPGTYLVGLRRLDRSSLRSWIRVQVTDLTLTVAEEPRAVVFAVNSLQTSLPVGGAQVRVEGSLQEGRGAARWTTFFTGTTDAAGRVTWNPPGRDPDRTANVRRIVVENGKDVLVLDPAHAPDSYADGQWSPSHDSWLGWVFDDLAERGPRVETLCHLFTERPVYRPEEGVHIKGYLRQRDRGELTPDRRPGRVIVEGPGDLVWRYPVEVTAAGSFYKFWKEEKLPTGVYSAHFEDKDGKSFGSVTWRMEAYRLPRFEVRLDSPDRVPLDREFKVGLTGIYYAGGRVAGRPIAWRVTQFPYTFTPKRRSGFLYSSDGRFSRTATFESTPRLEKQDTTDAEGAAKLVLNPAIEPTAQPRSYVVEATVTGADDQTVTATRQIIALPPFVLGLKVPRFLERATAIHPEVLVVGLDDKPIAGMAVKVRLLQRQWHSHLRASDFSDGVARYMTDVVDEKVQEIQVKSGAEALPVPLAIPRSGVYIVEIEASDRLGRTQVVTVDLYAGGAERPGRDLEQAAGGELHGDRRQGLLPARRDRRPRPPESVPEGRGPGGDRGAGGEPLRVGRGSGRRRHLQPADPRQLGAPHPGPFRAPERPRAGHRAAAGQQHRLGQAGDGRRHHLAQGRAGGEPGGGQAHPSREGPAGPEDRDQDRPPRPAGPPAAGRGHPLAGRPGRPRVGQGAAARSAPRLHHPGPLAPHRPRYAKPRLRLPPLRREPRRRPGRGGRREPPGPRHGPPQLQGGALLQPRTSRSAPTAPPG